MPDAHWKCPCGWEFWTDSGQSLLRKVRRLHLRSGHLRVRLINGEWKAIPND